MCDEISYLQLFFNKCDLFLNIHDFAFGLFDLLINCWLQSFEMLLFGYDRLLDFQHLLQSEFLFFKADFLKVRAGFGFFYKFAVFESATKFRSIFLLSDAIAVAVTEENVPIISLLYLTAVFELFVILMVVVLNPKAAHFSCEEDSVKGFVAVHEFAFAFL